MRGSLGTFGVLLAATVATAGETPIDDSGAPTPHYMVCIALPTQTDTTAYTTAAFVSNSGNGPAQQEFQNYLTQKYGRDPNSYAPMCVAGASPAQLDVFKKDRLQGVKTVVDTGWSPASRG